MQEPGISHLYGLSMLTPVRLVLLLFTAHLNSHVLVTASVQKLESVVMLFYAIVKVHLLTINLTEYWVMI